MFLRHKVRRKDGKEHRYWSIVENRRVSGGRTVQRHVLYLGERTAWCQTIEAFDENCQQALFTLPCSRNWRRSASFGVFKG
jgi:hypothetical protein